MDLRGYWWTKQRLDGSMTGASAEAVLEAVGWMRSVGGAVALGFGAPFFEAANTEIEQRARLAATVGLKVVPAELGNMAPLVGAAAMARRMIVRRAG